MYFSSLRVLFVSFCHIQAATLSKRAARAAAAAAAEGGAAAAEEAVKCSGLVLMNSAGRIIEGAGLTTTPVQDLFPPYKGPQPEFLRVFGKVIFSLLQPRIQVGR